MDDDYEFAEGYEVEMSEPGAPTGLSFAALVFNLITFTEDILQAFCKLLRNFRADIQVSHGRKQAAKSFTSSVERGIERL